MNWMEELFGVKKPIIAMCHLQPLPGDPHYNKEKGMDYVLECARRDLHALQNGGVDGIMFSNEFSLPYLTKVEDVYKRQTPDHDIGFVCPVSRWWSSIPETPPAERR